MKLSFIGKIFILLSIVLFFNSSVHSVSLNDIPPELLEKAKQNPELVQKYVDSGKSPEQNTSIDKNKEISGKEQGVQSVTDNNTLSLPTFPKEEKLNQNPFNLQEIGNKYPKKLFKLDLGDEISVTFFQEDGQVNKKNIYISDYVFYVPYIGEVNLNDFNNLNEFESKINKILQEKKIIMSIDEIKPALIQVGIFGDVLYPRYYIMERTSNLFDAISKAGGALNIEDIENIYIYRNKLLFKKIYYNELISGGSEKIELNNDDVIIVQNKKSSDNKTDEKYIDEDNDYDFDKLSLFGKDIFSGINLATPDQNVNVDDEYVVGVGDTLTIYIWGRFVKTYNIPVSSDGSIFVNELGKISVAGKKLKEVKEIINGFISSIEGVQGEVAISSLKTVRVLVVGEVKNPGFQTLNSLATITTAIAKAGGVTSIADLRGVYLKRGNKVVTTVDYYKLILEGDTSSDIYIQPNDVIFVPKANNLVYLAGSVKKPAIYSLKNDETLNELIRYAGGLLPGGFSKKIHIKRTYNDRAPEVFDIDINDAAKFKLNDGDKVLVVNIQKPETDSVYLYGEVYFPGRYSLKENFTIIDLIKDKSNLKPDASLKYGYIKRLNQDTKEYNIISFSLEDVFNSPQNGAINLPLMPLDEVYVMNKNDVRALNIVDVRGEVNKPGRYEIEEHITLYDILNRAGGLTTDASQDYIEIVRKVDGKFYTRFVSYKDAEKFKLHIDDKIIVHSIWEQNLKKYVKVEGEVLKPDTYLLTEGMTVGDLIVKAGGLTKNAYSDVFHIYRLNEDTFTYRLLTLDLKKDSNFILLDRDEVVIHSYLEYHPVKTVQIFGEVNKPGTYNYADNMTLYDLVVAAGNVKDSAYLDIVEIVRMKVSQGKTEYDVIDVNLNEILNKHANVELQPYDIVNIKKISDFKNEDKVSVRGEVYFPGEFVIRKGEKLSDVIERAGGVTKYGYIKHIIFKRRSVKEIQKKRLDDLKSRLEATLLSVSSSEISSALSAEDITAQKSLQANLQQIIKNISNTEPDGRIVIKANSLEELKNSSFDFALEDGDEIIIPLRPSTVNVVGEVYNQTSFIFDKENMTVKNYLDSSGGITELASEDDIFVVKGDGSVVSNRFIKQNYWWKTIYDVKIEPGDTVVVPRRLKFPSYMKDVKDITQILFQIATTAATTKVLF